MSDDMLILAALKKRGWTDALVRRFLPAPDAEKDNPHYKSAAPMRLYALARVEAVELTDDFKAAAERAKQRKAAAATRAATRAAALVEAARTTPIRPIPVMGRDELIGRAVAHYNHREQLRHEGNIATASTRSEPAFLDRICVNYLRHNVTDYDELLAANRTKPGVDEAYSVIRGRVLTLIGEAYPALADECTRQRLYADNYV